MSHMMKYVHELHITQLAAKTTYEGGVLCLNHGERGGRDSLTGLLRLNKRSF